MTITLRNEKAHSLTDFEQFARQMQILQMWKFTHAAPGTFLCSVACQYHFSGSIAKKKSDAFTAAAVRRKSNDD